MSRNAAVERHLIKLANERRKGGVCERHGNKVCSQCVVITDAARRASDAVNSMISYHGSWDIRNSWMAFRLEDGTGDGNLYDSKKDAVRHVSNYQYYFFFCFRNSLAGSNPRDMQIWLEMHRHAYENGGNLTDPDDNDGGPDMIVPTAYHDYRTGQSRQTLIPGIEY